MPGRILTVRRGNAVFAPQREARMSSQNPVFIPGPTNIPDELRRAIDMASMDHRSSAFADLLHPALAGIKGS